MAISAQRKAQLDAILKKSTVKTPAGMTSDRKAQLDAILSQQKAKTAEEKPGFLQGLVQSVASPFLKTATSAANLVEGTARLLTGDVKGASEAATKERDYGYFGQDIRPVGVEEGGKFKSTTGFAKDVIGTGAEVGSYLSPLSGVTKGAQAALKTGVRAALPTIVKDQAITGAASGLLGGAGQEAQKTDSTVGSIIGAGSKGLLLGGVTGSALPAAGALARGVKKGVGNVGAEILGKSTGAGEGAIREAFTNPNVIKFSRGGSGSVEDLMTSALDDARAGLSKLRQNRGSEYVEQLEKIKLNKSQQDGLIDGARSKAKELVSDLGIKFREGKLLNNLDFADSTIERAQGTVQKSFNDVMRWTDVTPAGLDKLKKKLDQHLDEIPVTERGGAFNFVLQLKNSISDGLKQNVPGYEQMTQKYGEASDLITEVQKALSLKDTVAKDTAIRKLMSTMRQNNELRKELLSAVGSAAGKDITGKIAGATLMAKTPRGLAGTLQPIGLGLTGLSIGASSIPTILLYLASTSPRLVAEFVTILGKIRGVDIPPAVQKQIRNLLIQAEDEATSDE